MAPPEIKIQNVQMVTWIKGEIQYQLLQISGKLSSDELISMAEEILSK